MKKIIFVLLFLFSTNSYAQLGITIQNAPVLTMNCADSCIKLFASFPKPLRTNTYNINSTGFSPIAITGTPVPFNDDKFSGAIPLGFQFCFFENVYTQCYISDNGVLTFNPAYANGNCNNNTQQTLPYFNSTFPDNAIFFMFMDLNPAKGGNVKYATMGTAPYRKFVLKYENVKLFGNTCTNVTSNFQVVLSETVHTIEVFITDKNVCDANPANYANYATVGIQNIGATLQFTAPSKHASIFTANGEGIKISPAGPPDYVMSWKNKGGVTIASNVDSVLVCPTIFPYNYYTATLKINCPLATFIDSISIHKPTPNINNIQKIDPLCVNDTSGSILVNANAQAPPILYAINNGLFGPSNVFNGLAPGAYTITVKDANGCKKDTVVFIQALVQLWTVTIQQINPYCPDSNGLIQIAVNGGTPPYNISWSNGDVGTTADSLGAGPIIATVIDANGCKQTFSFVMIFDGLPSVTPTVTNAVCYDSSGAITISISGGTPGYTVLWANGETTLTIDSLSAGTYFVSVTDINGCQKDTFFSVVNQYVTTTVKSKTDTKCGLNNGTATILAMGGLAPYTYNWMPSGQITPTATGLAPGTHVCITSDANGCSKVDTFYILSSLSIITSLSYANANCDSSNGSIYLNSVQNTQLGYGILWSNGQIGNHISGLAAGTYWVQVTDGVGCIKIDTIVLQNDGKPQLLILSYSQPLCNGFATGEAVLGGSFGTSPYKYSMDGVLFSSDAQLHNILAGVYTIYITDANSCINSTTITFTEPPILEINYTSDTVVCFNDKTATIQFNAYGGTPDYLYSFEGNIFSKDTVAYNQGRGNHPIIIKDANNCTRLIDVDVPGPQKELDVEFDKKDVYCFEQMTGSFDATIVGGWNPYSYTWNNGATGLSFDSLGETQMMIEVVDRLGCTIKREVNIEKLLCCKMVVPNAFTPNGDNQNDFLKPMAISDVSTMKFSIYNRWGKLVYQTKTLGDKWDGTDHEIICDMGTYFYYLEYTCPFEQKSFYLKGDITLIR